MDTRTGEIFRYGDDEMPDDKKLRMEEASASGHLVEVSERVATLMDGALKREDTERRQKRKAAKKARKKNR